MRSAFDVLLRRASTAPDVSATDWPWLMLGYLVSHLPPDETVGAVFAELEHAAYPIRFLVATEPERMLTKTGKARQIADCDLMSFLRFLRYLNGTLLREELWSMGCGVLRITFEDKPTVQLFR